MDEVQAGQTSTSQFLCKDSITEFSNSEDISMAAITFDQHIQNVGILTTFSNHPVK